MIEKLDGMLFDTIVHTNVKLKEAAVMGEAVLKYDKYCRGSKDYLSLAREILTNDRQPSISSVVLQAPAEIPTEIAVPVQASAIEIPAQAPYEPSERMQELIEKETASFLGATAFCLKAPEAKSVYVTGSFNDWSLDENCRMSNSDGVWTLKVNLKPGTYKYQFIVDGKWQEDPANTNIERNSFGDINSLIEVKA